MSTKARGRPPASGDRPHDAPRSAYNVVPKVARSADIRALAAVMPEDRGSDSLESHLRRLLRDLDLWGFHVRHSTGSEKGWPDWTIIGPCKIIFRELKSESGRLTPEQKRVGEMLQHAGQNWKVWRPSDLLSGQIARELTEVASLQESLFTYGKPA